VPRATSPIRLRRQQFIWPQNSASLFCPRGWREAEKRIDVCSRGSGQPERLQCYQGINEDKANASSASWSVYAPFSEFGRFLQSNPHQWFRSSVARQCLSTKVGISSKIVSRCCMRDVRRTVCNRNRFRNARPWENIVHPNLPDIPWHGR
jgi:hypothetical protein